jgi:hypothetical protein
MPYPANTTPPLIFSRAEKLNGDKVVQKNQLDAFAVCRVREAVVVAQLGVGGHAEGLVVTLAVDRLQPERAELSAAMKAAAFSSSGVPVPRPFIFLDAKNFMSSM